MGIFDKLYKEMAEQLPREDDKELLKSLLEAQREGGKQGLEERILSLVEKLAGGE